MNHVCVACLLVAPLMFLPGGVQAQRTPAVHGTVRNALTGDPVPFVVVGRAGSNVAVLGNQDGTYRIEVPPGLQELQFRKIGYRMGVDTVTVEEVDVVLDMSLTPIPIEFDPIEVVAEGENPATIIMRRAIERKNDLLSRIHDYRYEAYVKFIVRDLARDPDSSESVFLITETRTRAHWEQPDRYQEVILSRRQSSNLDPENNLVSVGQIVNFNRNRIDLQKYSVVSPTADDALEHYHYRLLDTLEADGSTIFRLAVEPKSDARPLFVGIIDVADSTYDVLAIEVGANTAIRFDFIKNLRYVQRMEEVAEDAWMPTEIRFTGELHIDVPVPGFPNHLSWTHLALLEDFRFDVGNSPTGLGEYLIVVDDSADRRDSTAWRDVRPIPLTESEEAAWRRIDSLEQQPKPLGRRVLSGVGRLVALGTDPDYFHYNRVEGVYLGAGMTLRDLSPRLILRAKVGRGMESEIWQHRYGAQILLWDRRRLWVGGAYRHEIVRRPTVGSGSRNPTFVALLSKTDPLDYYQEEGFNLTLSQKLAPFFRLALQYSDYDQRSLPLVSQYSLFDRSQAARPNPSVREGKLRSMTGVLSYDSRKLLRRKGRDYFLNDPTATRLSVGAEYAKPGFIDNDFDYLRLFLSLRRTQRSLNLGLTTVDAYLGWSSGTLPPQRYFTVDFGNGVFFEGEGFSTMDENNFSGNRMAQLVVTHDFDQQLFRRSGIPFVRDLPFTFSVHGGVFWTDFVEHVPNPGDELVLTAPSAYSELGFGLGNLTPFISPFSLTVWLTWQLSTYDTERFTINFGFLN